MQCIGAISPYTGLPLGYASAVRRHHGAVLSLLLDFRLLTVQLEALRLRQIDRGASVCERPEGVALNQLLTTARLEQPRTRRLPQATSRDRECQARSFPYVKCWESSSSS
jgi:hypothetical protein